jgi:acetyl esterase/lipase
MSNNIAEITVAILYLRKSDFSTADRTIMTPRSSGIVALTLYVLIASVPAQAQSKVQRNVIYGMYSGLALLMDVHRPDNPNGHGIVFVRGSSWRAPLTLDAKPLKDRPSEQTAALLASGYTLFVINHRAAPRFRYPAAIEDAQRAVRYVRYHASRYNIDPDRIGAFGGSSGGYLVSMLGVMDGHGISEDLSPVNQVSSKVQAVVALFPATDLARFSRGNGSALESLKSFMGMPLRRSDDPRSQEALLYAEASPTSHASADDPPFLLVHGDEDKVIPIGQSEIFLKSLTDAGVIAEFIKMPGGGHGDQLSAGPNSPDYIGSMTGWFDRHLRELP